MSNAESLTAVTLYLRGDLLDPNQVTSMLGVEGSKMKKKGETWLTSTGKEVTPKTGLWSLKVKDRSLSLSEQISWLEQQLIAATHIPLEIPGVDEAEISVFIALGENDRGGGDYESELSAANLAWLSSLKIPVSLTLTYVQEEEI